MNCPVLFIYWSYISLKKLHFFSRQIRLLSLYCWISCSLFLSLCVVGLVPPSFSIPPPLSRSLFCLAPLHSTLLIPSSLSSCSVFSVLCLSLALHSASQSLSIPPLYISCSLFSPLRLSLSASVSLACYSLLCPLGSRFISLDIFSQRCLPSLISFLPSPIYPRVISRKGELP